MLNNSAISAEKDPKPVGTITKALDLLGHFSVSRPEIGLSEFKRLSGRDKATVYRHLSELEANGFLQQNPKTKNYRLGPAVLRLANVRERTFPTRAAVAPIVHGMSEDLGELVHVSLLQGHALSPLYYADVGSHGTRVNFDEADLLPLHATASGIAILAFGPDELFDAVLKSPLQSYTDKTIIDPDELRRHVADALTTGIGRGEEGFEADVCSFAVPVFDRDSRAAGTLAVALPRGRYTAPMRAQVIAALGEGGRLVTRELGGHVPGDVERLWRDAA